MTDSGEDVLDYVAEDLVEEIGTEDYDPDEFLEEAEVELSSFGYDIINEVVWEFREEEEKDLEGDHLEVITILDDEGEESYLRFILEEGRPGKEEPPRIDRVYSPEEFDYRV